MRCLLLDANVIIDLHKLGYWDTFVGGNDVYVPDTVAGEAHFWPGPDGERNDFDLFEQARARRINILSAGASAVLALQGKMRRLAALELHGGELEGLAIISAPPVEDLRFCLYDRAAVKFAGALGLRDRIVSVEEALRECGLATALAKHSKERLDRLLTEGFALGLQSGIGPACYP